ncbi:DUF349 domain-containing protein [Actinokineospora diospyrosa]|uniref:DUF349 domain-containing protein n=1 Tax=Actinokineospora diospyrosa TaxID=103728 RepID=A0ABT1I4L3_9PSEU|nr:DUF349 domain-containing protein [Actinokineospora diospyrosa]MCP2267569.1 protein of unknown function (DUF349) [Actinokineospora diospyrosa]
MTDRDHSVGAVAEHDSGGEPDQAAVAAPVQAEQPEAPSPTESGPTGEQEPAQSAPGQEQAADEPSDESSTAGDEAATEQAPAEEPPAAEQAPVLVDATPADVPPPSQVVATRAPAASAPVTDSGPQVSVASNDPGKWGRVDAEGTVYVRTADGERAVGSWQAGEPEEGLAHFARRFDDIRTEVELLASRLASGSGDPKQAATNAKHIQDGLAEAHVVGDLVGLAARIDYVLANASVAVEAAKHAREEARAGSVARKQELVEEAEKLAEESTQWKVAGDRLRTILDEWKTIKGVDRKTDEQLWRRFSKARDTFNRRRGSHFADLDRQRATAKSRKQELVEEAERLSQSDDWGTTAGRYKELMLEWKAAGRAPKDADDTLWQRFRAAQDAFFAHRSAVFDERDAEFAENARLKEELLAEAEKITITDLDAARAALHKVQERWEAIGKVPRERIRELEGRLRTVEEKVRTAADAQWRRTDPEAEARAAQFRERVQQFETQAAKARAAGDKRRAEQAEAQAAQWREWLAAAEQAVATR